MGEFVERIRTLYAAIEGLEQRAGQEELLLSLAAQVEAAAEKGASAFSMVAEAPTGIGKSYVLLLVALAAKLHYGWRTVISSQTKVLQDQLIAKDVPSVRRLLAGVADTGTWKTSLVKGRGNYLCLRRLRGLIEMSDTRDLVLPTPFGDRILNRDALKPLEVLAFRSGADLEHLPIPEDDPLLEAVSGRGFRCTGRDCPFFLRRCPYYKALRKNAHLTVTNHAMLTRMVRGAARAAEDLAMDSGRPAEDPVNPAAAPAPGILSGHLYLFDEAHRLMGYATEGDVLATVNIHDVRDVLNSPVPLFARRGDPLEPFVIQAGRSRRALLLWWQSLLDLLSERPDAVLHSDAMTNRLSQAVVLHEQWNSAVSGLSKASAGPSGRSMAVRGVEDISASRGFLSRLCKALDLVRNGRGILNAGADGIAVNASQPRHLDSDLRGGLPKFRGAAFLSGTLLVDGKPDVFCVEVGIRPTTPPLTVETPFDYRTMEIWVPKGMPSPSTSPGEHEAAVVAFAERYVPPYVRNGLGGVLILCASLARMHAIAASLRRILLPEGRRVLEQGIMPRGDLSRAFLYNPSSVLVASASFREGFDAVRKRLTWVVIDKLPFASPDDPAFAERIRRLREWNVVDDPFSHALGLMKFDLVQSVGRLIRTQEDWGTITILDPRVRTRGKGWGLSRYLPHPVSQWKGDMPSEAEWIARAEALEKRSRNSRIHPA